MKPIAAIDIGSNTVHLTVMRVGPRRRLKHIVSRTHILGLGRIVERAHRLTPQSISAIRTALKELVRQARKANASPVLIGATAALRSAPNGREVLDQLSREIDIPIHLIPSGKECILGYEGIRSLLRAGERTLFVDSGGGSTQLTLTNGRTVVQCASLPIGSAKLSAALHNDPPSPIDLAGLMVPIHEALKHAPMTLKPRRVIFTGGTAHHLAILADESPGRLTLADINHALRRLIRHRSKKLARRFNIPVERIALQASGALILGSILKLYQMKQAEVTHQGIRDGMVLAYLRKGSVWYRN